MRKYILLFSTVISMAITSCSKSNPEPINQEELITTLEVTLSPQGGGNTVILKKQDLDADGPNVPVITVSGALQANTSYSGLIKLLNETETPTENITLELEEEGVDHQFFFTFENSLGATTYTDQDKNGNPIGITFELTTNAAMSGNLTVTLRHLPNKAGTGVVGGDITNAGGETDVEAIFPLTVN